MPENGIPVKALKKASAVKIFIPKTISESIKISEANSEKLSLIDAQESPSLEADLSYILKTNHKSLLQKTIDVFRHFLKYSEVITEYFLTYHQKKEDEIVLKKKSRKKIKKYIGDEILQVITFSYGPASKPLLIFVSDFEVGGTRYSKDFLQKEGYIPIERFVGGKCPKYIIVSAGPAASLQENNDEHLKGKYLIVPGKINFKFSERLGLVEYKYKLMSSTEFLYNNVKIRKMARENNVETAIITAERILMLERIDTSWKDSWRNFFKSIIRHKDIRYTLSGSLIFSLGSGILQGAIINPILTMMEGFGILVLLMWIMQYIYPNIVYTFSVLLSADRFDKLKSAEKDEIVEKATICIEIKKVLFKTTLAGIFSSFLLISIYPDFLVPQFRQAAFIKYYVIAIYVISCILKDWPITFEQDALFRILKRSLYADAELSKSLLKINAFAYSSSVFLNLTGLILGWAAMSVSSAAGITLAIAGGLSSFAKLLYPYYGNDYEIAFFTNLEPFFATEYEISIIPHEVNIRSRNPIRIHNYKKWKAIFDNYDFEIVLEDPKFEPRIIKKKHHYLASKISTWTIDWKHKNYRQKIIIILKNPEIPLELMKVQNSNQILYTLVQHGLTEPARG